MIKRAALFVCVTSLMAACSQATSPSSPSVAPQNGAASSGSAPGATTTPYSAPLDARGHERVGFGFNGTASGFPTGKVVLTGGGTFDRSSQSADSGGGFRCVEAVLQGPLSASINPKHPGACLDGEGVRWDTAALLESTTFKCTPSASEETAVTSGDTVVLQADFYRAGDGNDESFTAKMIVSSADISSNFPGVNLWVQGVGCGTARAVNFSR